MKLVTLFDSRSMKKTGFTLIELVVVIVILGVLAVVAAPKFIALSSESREAVLSQVQGAFKSVTAMVNSKAIINQIDDGNLEIEGDNIQIRAGYPSGHWNNTWRYALDIGKEISFTRTNQECTQHDLCGVGNQRNAPGLPIATSNRGLVLIWLKGMRLSDRCYSYYYNDETGVAPQVGKVTEGC